MVKETPCRATCKLTTDDLCVGCYRMAEEIVNWNKKSEQEREAILIETQVRRESQPYDQISTDELRPITSAEYRKYKI